MFKVTLALWKEGTENELTVDVGGFETLDHVRELGRRGDPNPLVLLADLYEQEAEQEGSAIGGEGTFTLGGPQAPERMSHEAMDLLLRDPKDSHIVGQGGSD